MSRVIKSRKGRRQSGTSPSPSPAVNAEGPERLIVQSEPSAEFYKDEGGKSNCLSMTVTTSSGEVPCVVPLKCTLYFESELPVEDWDQSILQLMCPEFEQYALSPDAPTVTIDFRLEKVSRRKDGQRFKVFVEPDLDAMEKPPEGFSMSGCFSRPICVMSKRRTGERQVTRRATPRPTAEVHISEEFQDSLHDIMRQLADVQQSVDSLAGAVRTQTARMDRMEQKLTQLLERPSQPSPAASHPAMSAAPQPALHVGMPYGMDDRFSGRSALPSKMTVPQQQQPQPYAAAAPGAGGVGRFRSNEIIRNLGLPTDAQNPEEDPTETDEPPDIGRGGFAASRAAAAAALANQRVMMDRLASMESQTSAFDYGAHGHDALAMLGHSASAMSGMDVIPPPAKRARLQGMQRSSPDDGGLGRFGSGLVKGEGAFRRTYSGDSALEDRR